MKRHTHLSAEIATKHPEISPAALLGLDEASATPFESNRFFFATPLLRQKLSALRQLLDHSRLAVVMGESGSGKTTLLRQLISDGNGPWRFKPLRLKSAGHGKKSSRLKGIARHMILLERPAQRPTLLIDDAHGLTPSALNTLIRRGLRKTGTFGLQNIVLFARPTLRKSLADLQACLLPNVVIDRIDIPPLTEKQTAAYLTHRVTQAGILPGLPFGPSEVHTIHSLSEGLPGRINQRSLELFEATAVGRRGCGNLRHVFNLQEYLWKIRKWRHRPVFAGP